MKASGGVAGRPAARVELPGKTTTERRRQEHRHASASLGAIRQAAQDAGRLSQPELRERIEDVQRFLVELMVLDYAEVSRLAAKLEALRERLLYSYFGQAQLRSVQEVLYDLHATIELHLAQEEEIYRPLLDKRVRH